MRSWRSAHPYVVATGVALVLLAAAWWWVVFSQVMLAGYITAPRALPCMAGQSARCALAEALCGGQHVLGIRRYDATLFWIGVGIVSATAAIPVLARVPRIAKRRRLTKSLGASRLLSDQVRS
jgi:hypothetical protein